MREGYWKSQWAEQERGTVALIGRDFSEQSREWSLPGSHPCG